MAKIRNLVAAAKVSLDKDRLNAVGSRSFDVAKKCPEKNIIISTKDISNVYTEFWNILIEYS